jgi:lysophospholipase L1-like esterase
MSHLKPYNGFPRVSALVVLTALALGCGSPTAPPPPPPPVPALTIACPVVEPVQSPDDGPVPVSFAPPVAQGGLAPVGTTCTAQSSAAFPVGTTSVSCTATDARGVVATCAFPVRVHPAPRLVGTRLLAFGDSITWGVDSREVPASAPTFAYPEQLRLRLAARYRFQTIEVINVGEPGEQAQDGGIRRFRDELVRHRPDIVLLMEGTNDLLSGAIGVERGVEALGVMIREAKAGNVRVLLSTIIPQRKGGLRNRDELAALVPLFNDGVRALAAAENVPLVDMFEVFDKDMSLLGIDDVHPTRRGFEVMAETFFNAIRTHFEVPPPSAGGLR